MTKETKETKVRVRVCEHCMIKNLMCDTYTFLSSFRRIKSALEAKLEVLHTRTEH